MPLGGFGGTVYVVVQVDGNVHDDGLKVPPALLSLHDTVPVGVVGELEVSVTCTENDKVPLEGSVVELGVTVVLVGSIC